ncbi:sulfite reductase subunit alpha [Massilia sp. TSP1-1-2]|uniref:sulfite reductase subunit alpha n=1 Tax=Massilia sp. TSP1-1-2 TaxID=2804649 RepID=UPI003CF09463
MINIDPARWALAGAMLFAYAGVCVATLRGKRRAAAPAGQADWLVVHASQTGTCEFLAERTRATLATGGLTVQVASMDDIGETELLAAPRILFIVSTYGEGDAPDSGARFARMLASSTADLSRLHYGVLALGDTSYAHFCGFGRSMDAALGARGARSLFARIEADRVAPAALQAWQHHLSHLAGTSDAPDWSAPQYGQWRIAARRVLNAGSAGAPAYLLSLQPVDGALPAWQAGDLVQVSAPAAPDYPREYSIASLPADGSIELLVRLHLHEDGSEGAASGWLCTQAGKNDTIALRLREHKRFHAGANAQRPMILIGNGTGIAGLRAHLKSRVASGAARTWLVFGERNAQHDYLFQHEIEEWQRSGALAQLDLAFSRDGGALRYVQHVLAARETPLRDWVAQGAAIYVCGSLQGMAGGVHDALVAALGQQQLDQLDAAGRYRRDVY